MPVFSKKHILKNVSKFTGKHLRLSFFYKELQKKFQQRCFHVNFAKLLRTPILFDIKRILTKLFYVMKE